MTLEEKIKKMIIEKTGSKMDMSEIGDEEFLLGGRLYIDSIIVLEIIVELEEEYGFEFDDDDISLETFNSVKSITDLLREKTNIMNEGVI